MLIRWLPRPSDYQTTWEAMRAFTAARTPDTPDEMWLVEHSPVYTQGLAGKPEHLLAPSHIPVVQSDRGGQVTYHGPGQVVAYVLLDLRRVGYFVKEYVSRVEQALIDTLAEFGVNDAQRKDGAPGVYVPWPRPAAGLPRDPGDKVHGEQRAGREHPLGAAAAVYPVELAKIAALGIKVHKHCTYHGLALNVAMDLSPFDGINPCGYAGLRTVDLAACGIHVDLVTAGDRLAAHLTAQLLAPAGGASRSATTRDPSAAVE
ncbi:lipoyl(octanoyl) transferase [Pigmentiphaga litoralis]|uniref:Octanoyltransferase n=1 Tax=Pigmentiphaga litoralis TaxID=516702 RepID=A0A7Y9ISF6_9BURK|nr:lipoyl(octanoyl) transferase [Pigmentiphaga litoralis]NYE81985.1 lipoyl(octanoyl) transferase [Pigmentiphaga litoralis]